MAVRRGASAARIPAAAFIALVAAPVLLGPSSALAARLPVLSSTAIERNGAAQEIRFGFRGVAPRWDLSTRGDELWLDFSRAQTGVPPRPLFGSETAPIRSVRVIDRGGGRMRIAIEVEGKTDYALARLRHEILLRVAVAGAVPNLAAPILIREEERSISPSRALRGHRNAPPAAAPPVVAAYERPAPPELHSAAPSFERARPLAPAVDSVTAEPNLARGHPLVMIDPGHGGHDPGTNSASGIQEKDLALAVALRLRQALIARGIHVVMTRSTDVFIPLPERTQLANHNGADLFVSVHLNSSPNTATTGIEVYYLNNTTDRATIRLARMENGGAGTPYGAPDDANLNYILADLRQQYKATESASLARMIDAQTVADLDAGLGLNVNGLGAKMGPFWVLVGAKMPAVLVECGFLSNSGEAHRLATAQYQDLLASGIATAVVHYFNADAAVGNL
jgi:N-acetylmuramoyl-L-alanine amidase